MEDFCVRGTTEVCACIKSDIVSAVNKVIDEEFDREGEFEPTISMHDIIEDALGDFLRGRGKLPNPYV